MVKPYQEERFEYKGFPCVILFVPMCHRCGYVGLPKTSRFYGKGYDKIDVNCHGGLTYARDYLSGQEDKDTWWIGFDCMHWLDAPDYRSARAYFKDDEAEMKLIDKRMELDSKFDTGGEIRTREYVHDEYIDIVNQIIMKESEVN